MIAASAVTSHLCVDAVLISGFEEQPVFPAYSTSSDGFESVVHLYIPIDAAAGSHLVIRNISIAKQPLSTPPSFPLHCHIASKLRSLVVEDMVSMRLVLVRALHLWLPSALSFSEAVHTGHRVCF
jgi:hypothetical protein